MRSGLRAVPGFIVVVVFSFILYGLMMTIQNSNMLQDTLFSHQTLENKAQSEMIYKFLWFLGDMTEAQFYKSIFASIGLILFAFLAHYLYKKRSKWAGFGISYDTGLLPWVFLSSTIGLAISVSLYIDHIQQGWIPTFVAFVSAPAGVVLLYGGGWKNTLTGAILGGFLTFPISWFIIKVVLIPLELPNVIGNVTGMWLGAIIVFEICRYLPWMGMEVENSSDIQEVEVAATEETDTVKQGSIWFIRRVLADFTEPQFFANEIATIGLLLGAIFGWILNPESPFYGSGLFPALLLSQFLTLAIGNLLYFDQWKKLGWYPTFVPVVSVAPAIVSTYNGSMLSILGGAFLGALIAPPIAQMVIRKIPSHWHPVVGNTFSMALSTLIIMEMLKVL